VGLGGKKRQLLVPRTGRKGEQSSCPLKSDQKTCRGVGDLAGEKKSKVKEDTSRQKGSSVVDLEKKRVGKRKGPHRVGNRDDGGVGPGRKRGFVKTRVDSRTSETKNYERKGKRN